MFDQGISLDDFQKNYWRKQPARLGQIDMSHLESLQFVDFLELAEDENLESRLLTEVNGGFDVTFGPFDSLKLGNNRMLMLQNLESFSYQISYWLTQHFDFLPRWRIEDVMATVSQGGGSCGAHYDQYDVFLVQLKGAKSWQLDDGGHTDEELVAGSEVRLLADFSPTSSLTQNPGDVLYIPPGVGHHGVADNECITLSVGIRNPLMTEMASHLADLLLQEQDSGLSLSDQLTGQTISSDEINQLGERLTASMTRNDLMSVWYGSYMTLPRDPELIDSGPLDIDVANWRQENERVFLDLPARIAVQDQWLFVNGEALTISNPTAWLVALQQNREIPTDTIPETDDHLLNALLPSGAVLLYPDE